MFDTQGAPENIASCSRLPCGYPPARESHPKAEVPFGGTWPWCSFSKHQKHTWYGDGEGMSEAPTLPGDSAGWLQGWPYGQRSCGQVRPRGEYPYRWGLHSAVGEEPRPSVRSTVTLLGACSSAAAGLQTLLSVIPLNSGSSLAVGQVHLFFHPYDVTVRKPKLTHRELKFLLTSSSAAQRRPWMRTLTCDSIGMLWNHSPFFCDFQKINP